MKFVSLIIVFVIAAVVMANATFVTWMAFKSPDNNIELLGHVLDSTAHLIPRSETHTQGQSQMIAETLRVEHAAPTNLHDPIFGDCAHYQDIPLGNDTSIDSFFGHRGLPGSLHQRMVLAAGLGIDGYVGSATQNALLLSQLKKLEGQFLLECERAESGTLHPTALLQS